MSAVYMAWAAGAGEEEKQKETRLFKLRQCEELPTGHFPLSKHTAICKIAYDSEGTDSDELPPPL